MSANPLNIYPQIAQDSWSVYRYTILIEAFRSKKASKFFPTNFLQGSNTSVGYSSEEKNGLSFWLVKSASKLYISLSNV